MAIDLLDCIVYAYSRAYSISAHMYGKVLVGDRTAVRGYSSQGYDSSRGTKNSTTLTVLNMPT